MYETKGEREIKSMSSSERLSEARTATAGHGAVLRRIAPVVIVYILATYFTDAYYMADTVDYVSSVTARARGDYYYFWEFGHLLWRPLGWLCFKAMTLLSAPANEAETRVRVVWIMLTLNWLAGLLGVLCLYGLVRIVSKGREWVSVVVTIAFIFSHGFLNFVQTGCSYVPGLSMLLLGLWILARATERGDDSWRTAALAGASLAAAVCFWFLYVWAIPAALLLPLILFRADEKRKRLAWRTTVVCALVGVLLYVAVLVRLNIKSVAGLKAWMAMTSDGNNTRGLLRAVFGLARSFINMGNDGILFKRYLLHDPLNAVSALDLFRLSLWKVGFFYLFLSAIIYGLLRSAQGRRVGLLLAAGAIPMLAFAVLFDGGAVERYLPLYPLIFLSLAYVLADASLPRWTRGLALTFAAVAGLVSIGVMAKPVLNRQQETIAARVKDLPAQLKPRSLVLTANWLDTLINFNRSFPLHPLNREGGLVVNALVSPGTEQSVNWRREFARSALKAWREGGDVWVSKRVFASRPQPDWNWTEGDDHNVAWGDFPAFFVKFQVGQQVGGDDGFVSLVPTVEAREFLEQLASGEARAARESQG